MYTSVGNCVPTIIRSRVHRTPCTYTYSPWTYTYIAGKSAIGDTPIKCMARTSTKSLRICTATHVQIIYFTYKQYTHARAHTRTRTRTHTTILVFLKVIRRGEDEEEKWKEQLSVLSIIHNNIMCVLLRRGKWRRRARIYAPCSWARVFTWARGGVSARASSALQGAWTWRRQNGNYIIII